MNQVAGGVEANQWQPRPLAWWLRLLLLSLIALLIWWSYSFLTRAIRARNRELERLNPQLSAEIAERQSAERRLREAHEPLERRVAERTAELMTANAVLRCEIHERRKAEEALKERLALEDLIAAIATDFVRPRAEQVDPHINQALAALGAFAQVDRSYVFVFSLDGTRMSCTHEWVAEGIHQEIENLRDLSVDDFPWWMEQLRAQENIYIPCVDALPSDAVAEKEILQA